MSLELTIGVFLGMGLAFSLGALYALGVVWWWDRRIIEIYDALMAYERGAEKYRKALSELASAIEPREPTKELRELMRDVTPQNIHGEVSTGSQISREF